MSTDKPKRLPRIPAYELPQPDELPASRADWHLDKDHAALLVHDMQAYFLAAFEPGSNPVSGAMTAIAELLAAARAANVPVFYTAQRGNQDPAKRGLQGDLWGPGMQAIPEHETIPEVIAPAPGDTVLTKHRYSAFRQSDLKQRLDHAGRDQLIITGLFAHIGCQCTAADAFQLDIQPFMVADALADYSRLWHDATLAWVAGSCGVVSQTTDIVHELTT